MELIILEDKTKRLTFDLKGADNTLANIIKDELWQEKGITVATYHIEHPLHGVPRFIIETDGSTNPRKALKSAITSLQKKNNDFKKKFLAA